VNHLRLMRALSLLLTLTVLWGYLPPPAWAAAPRPAPLAQGPGGRRQVFRSDFNTPGNLEGWNIMRQPGNTSVQVTNGYLQLSTFGDTAQYPVVERTGIPWPTGDMAIEWRFSSPDAAGRSGFGVNTWVTNGFTKIGSYGIYGSPAGYIWSEYDSAGSLRQGLDTAWHTALIIRRGGVYDFYLDGVYKASWAYANAPTWTAIGDPSTQAWAGLWLTMRLDYYAVYDYPPTPTPTGTPTRTPTATPSLTPSATATPTWTPSATATPTASATPTATASPTPAPGQVIGYVFLDSNGDGWRQGTETAGLAGVSIHARQGSATYSVQSGANGWYQISGLPPGSYTVTEDQPVGYVSTSPDTVAVGVPEGLAVIVNFGEQARTATPTPTVTASATATGTPSPSATATATRTPTSTPTATPTRTPTATASATVTGTATSTPTWTPTPSATPIPVTLELRATYRYLLWYGPVSQVLTGRYTGPMPLGGRTVLVIYRMPWGGFGVASTTTAADGRFSMAASPSLPDFGATEIGTWRAQARGVATGVLSNEVVWDVKWFKIHLKQ
jgi:hypothetical protein